MTKEILKVVPHRPQAYKGEEWLTYILFDWDGDTSTIDDQTAFGGGPTRPHLPDLGAMHIYNAHPWRMIFDADQADKIVPYSGDCAAAEAAMGK